MRFTLHRHGLPLSISEIGMGTHVLWSTHVEPNRKRSLYRQDLSCFWHHWPYVTTLDGMNTFWQPARNLWHCRPIACRTHSLGECTVAGNWLAVPKADASWCFAAHVHLNIPEPITSGHIRSSSWSKMIMWACKVNDVGNMMPQASLTLGVWPDHPRLC